MSEVLEAQGPGLLTHSARPVSDERDGQNEDWEMLTQFPGPAADIMELGEEAENWPQHAERLGRAQDIGPSRDSFVQRDWDDNISQARTEGSRRQSPFTPTGLSPERDQTHRQDRPNDRAGQEDRPNNRAHRQDRPKATKPVHMQDPPNDRAGHWN